MRNANQMPIPSVSANIAPKIHGQSPKVRIRPPIAGASIGTVMNTMMVSDITRAISRPAKRSRTIATASTRPVAPPIPWMKRARSSPSKLCASIASTQPTRNTTIPVRNAGRRPTTSEAGP